jgi:hypothetical protein
MKKVNEEGRSKKANNSKSPPRRVESGGKLVDVPLVSNLRPQKIWKTNETRELDRNNGQKNRIDHSVAPPASKGNVIGFITTPAQGRLNRPQSEISP